MISAHFSKTLPTLSVFIIYNLHLVVFLKCKALMWGKILPEFTSELMTRKINKITY